MASYCTATDVGTFLRTDIDNTTIPSLDTVNDWIEDASAKIDSLTDSYTSISSSSVYVSTEGWKDIWLPKEVLPLNGITKLYVNSGTDFAPVWNEKTEGTDFLILETNSGHIKFANNITLLCLEHGVKLDLTYGFTTVPATVKDLCIKMVALQYIKSKLSNVSVTTTESIKVGPISIENGSRQVLDFVNNLEAEIKQLTKSIKSITTYIY